ncbi:hypothetical protein JYU34_005643 [Plutella xylostella]|uniref:Uncharacterized protein n=1 Tax=Plutella xylostella TaxID=51655 RepID=A0ABQ7QTR8_PLUXY|nr:hypothetical protein JYU34_005643 [Plutella xylostella]
MLSNGLKSMTVHCTIRINASEMIADKPTIITFYNKQFQYLNRSILLQFYIANILSHNYKIIAKIIIITKATFIKTLTPKKLICKPELAGLYTRRRLDSNLQTDDYITLCKI